MADVEGSRSPSVGRLLVPAAGISAAALAASGVFLVALAIYIRTLPPGPSFGDWGEMQMIPAQLGIPHPTGYPLYVILGKAFSLLPIGSVAYRAGLLSAVAGAGASAVAVLIAVRLGVRPLIAAICGLALAVTETLWLESTFSEMNGLHLLLVGLVIHRALVWRDKRRDRDLQIGALLCGLSLSNHLLAATVVPIVVAFILVLAWRRLVERPVLIAQLVVLVAIGLTPYLFIPLRGLVGPPSIYGSFATWDGFSSLVTGAQFRRDMHFGTGESLAVAWRAVPDVMVQLQQRSNILFVIGGVLGGVVHLARDRWAALLFVVLVVVNVYFFANYTGTLDHYLLLTWLVLAVWLGVLVEAAFAKIEARLSWRISGAEVLLVLLPIAIMTSHWAVNDQSQNRLGEQFAERVFGDLPENALLVTYWDALTTLSYEHCIEGERPDVSLRAYDESARVTCDPITGSLEAVARTRPVFALFPFDSDLDRVRDKFALVGGPLLAIPYGERVPDHAGVLYQLVPRG